VQFSPGMQTQATRSVGFLGRTGEGQKGERVCEIVSGLRSCTDRSDQGQGETTSSWRSLAESLKSEPTLILEEAKLSHGQAQRPSCHVITDTGRTLW
jgi:predicted Ser/Thr protein kinase